jgi:hypothetical protein
MNPLLRVKPVSLNLRQTPVIKDGNIIANLFMGQEVEVLEGNPDNRFWKVRTIVNGTEITGFLSSAFLRKPVSEARENLISIAVKEWLRFGRGNKFEYEDPQYKYVGEYWSQIGLSHDGRDRDQPWSAAFISFAVKYAGYSNFRFAASHSTYVIDAVDQRMANNKSAAFWGFDVNERKPTLGDLICRSRGGVQIVSMSNLPRGGFKSHCDIVVELNDAEVRTLGGNVNDSVSVTSYPLDESGFLRKVMNVYGLLGNNF